MAAAACAMGVKVRPQCYFDIEINREPVGRITFQLFSDVCQKTCTNFLYLCTGEKGIGKSTGKKLCYKGSTFHRVVKNFMIQGGDFSEGNGKGGESIYGGYFKDENFILKHDRAFLLSMANRGKHTNGSQFFITTRPAPHLDNVHVVFGLVISGFEVIEQIENLKTDAVSRPYADVRVIDCGLIQTQPPNDVSEKITKVPSDPEASASSSKSATSSDTSFSESELEIEKIRKRKRKRTKIKTKHAQKRKKEERCKVEPSKEERPKMEPRKEAGPKVELRKEEGPKVAPRNEEGPKVALRKEEGPKVELRKEEGPKVALRIEGGPKVAPSKEEGPKVAPSKEEGPKVAPSKEEGPKVAPSKGEGPKVAPSKGEGPKVAPCKGEGPKVAPCKGEGPKVAPCKGEGPKVAPCKGEGPKVAPSKGEGPKVAPSKGEGPKVAPSKGEGPKVAPRKEKMPKLAPRKEKMPKGEPRKEKRRKAPRKEERRKESKTERPPNQRSNHSDKNDLNEEPSKDLNSKREKLVLRPEEIPPVPENKFLLRRDVPVPAPESEPKPLASTPVDSDQKPSVSKSGRKIKGRGTMRYHTPPRSRSCSESEDDDDDKSSETPPHWKEEMQRLRAYKPSSGEKWSKGDKLKDANRWEDRSQSQRSRSWSHDGYYSDLSTGRHGDPENHKKDKRIKHKKKSKKQKHSKKQKQPKQEKTPVPEVESRSSLGRTKSSHGQQKRSSSSSSSVSSKHSSKREWSKSDKEQLYSSPSTRKSRSYSKSRSRSYSRDSSRSRTGSSSRSRSRMRSRSRLRSRSSTRSRSRSKSRSSSKSRRRRSVSRSPKYYAKQSTEGKTNKTETLRPIISQNDKPVALNVTSENVPLIPLSDSPPPSRWKPGLKPWKPSYERIQEIKAKTSNVTLVQSSSASARTRQTDVRSYNKRRRSSDSDQSERSSYYRRKSKSRSSRSRSYTRSYTRSRSPTSSRSRSRSSATSQSLNKYLSATSSYYRSSSSDSYSDIRPKGKRKTVSRKKNLDPKTKESSSESVFNSQSTIDYNDCDHIKKTSKSVATIDSTVGKDSKKRVQKTIHEKVASKSQFKPNRSRKCDQIEPLSDLNSNSVKQESTLESDRESDLSEKTAQAEETSSEIHMNGEDINRPAQSDSKPESTPLSEKEEKQPIPEDPIASSSKEEGEASSESEPEVSDFKSELKTRSQSSEIHPPIISESNPEKDKKQGTSDTQISPLDSGNHREKAKKPKHRSTKKNLKKARLKAKEKAKLKKEKKHKLRKPAFLWQPPLEFGEEEEEEVVLEKPITRLVKKDKGQQSENRKAACDQSPGPSHPSKENIDQTNSANITNPETLPQPVNADAFLSNKNSQMASEDDSQTDDDMELCTPDNSSPENNNLELSSLVSMTAVATKTDNGQLLQTDQHKIGLSNHRNSATETTNGKGNETVGTCSNSFVTCDNNHTNPEMHVNSHNSMVDNKWKPVQGAGNMKEATELRNMEVVNTRTEPESKPPGVRIEIKSKNRVRPGSLFDEVRKTARLNRRPRNQESSSEESSLSSEGKSPSRSPSRSHGKSHTRSLSYSRSRSRSRSSSYTSRSRSYTRSRSRRRYSSNRTRGHSSSSDRYRSHSRTYSRSRSRSRSYSRHRRSRSRSYTYDSYSRSRSRSKRSYSRSRSYDRRSRSRGSYHSSRSDFSYSYSESSTDS